MDFMNLVRQRQILFEQYFENGMQHFCKMSTKLYSENPDKIVNIFSAIL